MSKAKSGKSCIHYYKLDTLAVLKDLCNETGVILMNATLGYGIMKGVKHWEDLHNLQTSIFQMTNAGVVKSCTGKGSICSTCNLEKGL